MTETPAFRPGRFIEQERAAGCQGRIGCDRPVVCRNHNHDGRPLCRRCHDRWGSSDPHTYEPHVKKSDQGCTIVEDGQRCTRDYFSNGMCTHHYGRNLLDGSLRPQSGR